MLPPHREEKRVSQSRSKVGRPVGGGPAGCGEESWDSGKVGLSQDGKKLFLVGCGSGLGYDEYEY